MTDTLPPTAPSRSYFADDLAAGGANPALIAEGRTITYTDLDGLVTAFADALGSDPRLVALAVDTTIDTVVAYLAALRGRHPVILVAGGDRHAVDSVVTTYDPDAVIVDGELTQRRSGSRYELHPELALLLSTSGSTGTPKLVRLSRDNLAANAAAIAEYLGLSSADRAITTLPLQYCYGLSVLNSHLHVGASIVLTSTSVVDTCFWDLFDSTRPTGLAGVPHTFDLLDRVGFHDMRLRSLRYLTQAGGRMRPETVRRYAELGAAQGWDIYVMYGQTEATARMAYLPPHLAADHPGAVGIPIPGGSLTLDESDGDGIGELVYRGPNVMLGYAHSPADLAAGRTVSELRTGDLARRTPEGLIEIVGRRNRVIKPFGIRVDLDDLERVLESAGVTAWCAGDDDTLNVAVTSADAVEAARAWITERIGLPPSRLHIAVADPPRLPSGKVDYSAIPSLVAAPPAPDVAVGPVHAVFAKILDVEPRDDDTFVGLGGDSLSYVEMSVALEDVLGALPRDWHTTPIGQLLPVPTTRRWWAPIETSVLIRAIAIVLIVATHTRSWQQPGGAHALLAVAGFNFARFQLPATNRWTSIVRIALPSMCWMGILALTADGFAWPHALLVNGLVNDPDARWAYWFIEALLYILVPLCALLAVPHLAAAERARPFLFSAGVLAIGLVVRFDVVVDLTVSHRIYRPHEVLWLFALGWAAAVATRTHHRLLVTAATVATVPGFFGDSHRELIVAGAVLLVLWAPTVPIPRATTSLVVVLAASSLYTYLTHFQVYPPAERALGAGPAVVLSLLVGAASATAAHRLTQRVVGFAARVSAPRDDGEVGAPSASRGAAFGGLSA